MTPGPAFLGLDIGTSGVKALLIDDRQGLHASADAPLTVSRPHPLWSEQDPDDWWRAVLDCVAALRAQAPDAWRRVQAIGLSGQMHGAVLLDAAHRVLRPAILWNDGRAGAECTELARRVPDLARRAGNIAMPGFTAPKLLWVAAHEPDVFAATAMVLLPKDEMRRRLTGACVSDMSDASGTLWLDVAGRRWDPALLAATGLGTRHMPALVEGSDVSATLLPRLALEWGLPPGVLVAGGGGDNAASAVGIGAVAPGDGFLSLGTSGVLFAATDRLVAAPARTLHAFCHALPGRWHAMGVMLSAGAALSWAAGVLGQDVGALLARTQAWAAVPGHAAAAPLFLPYLSGERTPHNDPEASGVFAGLRLEHGPEAIAYAVMEGVAFAFADHLAVLADAGAALGRVLAVGGGARSAFWLQTIADALNLALEVPDGAEHGAALGAARLAMLAAGHLEAQVCTPPAIRRVHAPQPGADTAQRLERFRRLYAAERRTRPLR